MEQLSAHDRFLKGMLSHPEAAHDLFKYLLPGSVSRHLDLKRLKSEHGSYIDSKLRGSYADVLFSCRIEKSEALVYLLLEHQSTVDWMMPMRMAEYWVEILKDWRKANPRKRVLPAVLPIVLHQSNRAWQAPQRLLELVDLTKGTESFHPIPAFLRVYPAGFERSESGSHWRRASDENHDRFDESSGGRGPTSVGGIE